PRLRGGPRLPQPAPVLVARRRADPPGDPLRGRHDGAAGGVRLRPRDPGRRALTMPRAMRVVVAPDSFKGSLSAVEVCAAVEAGVRRGAPHAEVAAVPMADGGEGTLDCFLRARGGAAVEVA